MVVCHGRFEAVIPAYLYFFEAGMLQHQYQLILAVVFHFLGVDFFLEQLVVPPQPCPDLMV
jgi:hypothetical protein